MRPNLFEQIISLENLFSAWDSFKKNKRGKRDILEFEWNLEPKIFQLHRDLKNRTYRHGPYSDFYIRDPKVRHVHKAEVRDRILHHAIFNVISPVFEPTFISTSFSCRKGFGAHKGVERLGRMLRKVSRNGSRPCYVLKCDIKKFFDTIDHRILMSILRKRIGDDSALKLLEEVVGSFASEYSNALEKKGVPIGNLTSQIFANIYMNEFDQFMKKRLKVKFYARYTDDFVIVSEDSAYLHNLIPLIEDFLGKNLQLRLHPEKVYIRKMHQGIDFLGYVSFLNHKLLRSKTKQRIFVKLRKKARAYRVGEISSLTFEQSLNSYLGVLSHANTYQLRGNLLNQFWFSKTSLD